MAGVLIASLQVRAQAITEWDIALLTVIVGIMIAVGLLRAWSLHLRTQIVIQDVEPEEGVPAETAAQLSQQLRQSVRGILNHQRTDARHAAMETFEQDIKDGLMAIHGTITMDTTIEQLVRTTQDSMSTISAALAAVSPKESEGLAAALQLAIPAQRGWSVRAFPARRGNGIHTQVGLDIEIARLGHAPEVVTTFWTTSSGLRHRPASEAERHAVISELLHELVQPASAWIAIWLVSQHLTQMHRWYDGLLPVRRRRQKELIGLQAQLAGQMLLYATRTQQEYAHGFAGEALGNLKQAAGLLPRYYRPHLTRGAVYERLGWSYRKSGDDSAARHAFSKAVDAFDLARGLLLACKADADKRDAAIERIALRQTKCHLLSWDREHADATMKELSEYSRLKDTRPKPLYNAACLFALAMACPELPDDQRLQSEWHAWHFLGLALLCSHQGSGLWSRMMVEEELDMLDVSRRKSFRDALRKEHGRQLSYSEADPIVKAAIADLRATAPGQGSSLSHFALRRQRRRHQGGPATKS